MAYAEASDVAVRLGRELTSEEEALVEVRLEDVERMILRRIPDLAAKILAGTVLQADVIRVESESVLRVVRNPDGFIQETDGNYTYMLSKDAASGKLTITAEEWDLLGLAPTGAKAFVIRPKFVLPWEE